MAFTTVKFLGATVRDFSSHIGLSGDQPSSIEVRLVEDTDDGDNFVVPEVGSPVYFQFYNFRFFGLLQRWKKLRSTSDYPTFSVTIQDPREILDACQVIMAGYSGVIAGTRNVLNVFGYWENALGFGGSLLTEAGMPYFKVATAIQALTASPVLGSFGGPLGYHGYNYRVDLSRIPAPPLTYRLGSDNLSILQIVSTVLEDAGCDFYVTLSGLTIVIWPISRRTQPPLGTINAISENIGRGDVISSESGMEARNDPTTTFLVGGEVETLHLSETISSFWGFNILGQPILGVPFTLEMSIPEEVPNVNDQFTTIEVQTERMDLNASPVAAILGSTTYNCTEFELRLALASMGAWQVFIKNHRHDIQHLLLMDAGFGVAEGNNVQGGGAVLGGNAMVADGRQNVLNNLTQWSINRATLVNELYAFVRKTAEDYLGKKYVVGIPQVLLKTDPDTGVIHYSHQVSDGGYLPEGSSPLGVNVGNEDRLSREDGRFIAFARFTDTDQTLDFTRMPPEMVITEENADGSIDFYLKVSVDPTILQVPDSAVVVTLPFAVHLRPIDQFGGLAYLAAVEQRPLAQEANANRNRHGFGNFPPGWIAPEVVAPSQAAIPLKSNILTYGPWYLHGAVGKVTYIQDRQLVPWAYGGYTNLNAAAYARLASSSTNMQISESGMIELAGTPLTSLGGILMNGGPNVTNIDVSFGQNGVSTIYRFNTFTPRFGVFGKGISDRIKKIGIASQVLRQEIRQNVRQAGERGAAYADGVRGLLSNNTMWQIVNPQTPHTVLVAQCVEDGDTVRQGIATETLVEATMATNADDEDLYQGVAIMSWDGLLRPVDVSQDGVSQNMSAVAEVDASVEDSYINGATYNPWKNTASGVAPLGHSFEVYTWGDTYNGLKSFIHQQDDTSSSKISQSAKVIGLRGPLLVSGWGYDLEGQFQPSGVPDYLLKPNTWKSGPVDMIWDDKKRTWTVHDIRRGRASGTITARSGTTDGTGTVDLDFVNTDDDLTSSYSITVYNMFSTSIADGTYVMVAFDVDSLRHYIVAADCEA